MTGSFWLPPRVGTQDGTGEAMPDLVELTGYWAALLPISCINAQEAREFGETQDGLHLMPVYQRAGNILCHSCGLWVAGGVPTHHLFTLCYVQILLYRFLTQSACWQ